METALDVLHMMSASKAPDVRKNAAWTFLFLSTKRATSQMRTTALMRDMLNLSLAKPRNPRHFDGIGGGRERVLDVFIDKDSVSRT